MLRLYFPSIFIEHYGVLYVECQVRCWVVSVWVLYYLRFLFCKSSRLICSISRFAMIQCVLNQSYGTLPLCVVDSALGSLIAVCVTYWVCLLRGAGLWIWWPFLPLRIILPFIVSGGRKTPWYQRLVSELLTLLGGAIGTASIGFFYQWE